MCCFNISINDIFFGNSDLNNGKVTYLLQEFLGVCNVYFIILSKVIVYSPEIHMIRIPFTTHYKIFSYIS
jgi:hypothetical protein